MIENSLLDIKNLSYGMDVIIISVTSTHEAIFWQKRLDEMRGQIVKRDALILTVYEDWDKGAGNALGTLYAFQKACEISLSKYNIDLVHLLDQEKSIAIYHTAGKGTRLSPMTGCEYNSKSRIKLVGRLFNKNSQGSITLLEAVIRQTSILAPKRKGRLSVFWGDQIFIPSDDLKETLHEIDLLIKPIDRTPTEKEWIEKGYDKYGFVIVDEKGQMRQLEKLSYMAFSNIALAKGETIAFSLGSFSLSKSILEAFLKEFEPELKEKNTSLDSDPHLWMPLSLSKELYLAIMNNREANSDFYEEHFWRMQSFKNKFLNDKKDILLGATSMGKETLWWDYGNRQSYFENSLKLIENTEESKALRNFFSITHKIENSCHTSDLKVENSILINCNIRSGVIKNSVLINVSANKININKSVILNSSAQNIESKESILYNCLENGLISVQENQIRADNFSEENGQIKLYHKIYSDLAWDVPVEDNPLSFQELYQINQQINPAQGQKLATVMQNKIKQALFDLQM